MDDIDQTIWHNRLREANLTCAIYWRQPLSKQKAHLNNEQYRTSCLKSLNDSADKLHPLRAYVGQPPKTCSQRADRVSSRTARRALAPARIANPARGR